MVCKLGSLRRAQRTLHGSAKVGKKNRKITLEKKGGNTRGSGRLEARRDCKTF